MAKLNFKGKLYLAEAGQPLVKIANLTTVPLPNLSRETIDVSTHDSADAMEFMSEGMYDPGNLELEGHYIAGSTNDDLFYDALITGQKLDFLTVANGQTAEQGFSGSAIIESYEPAARTLQGIQLFSATLKVTGAIARAAFVAPV